MKFSKKIILLLIVILALFLRLYQLGLNPPSLDWDEASLGYNAYSLLKTGKDEFGRPWPISIRSFEDYKPAVYTYLTIPAVAVFGLNEFAVRLPTAVLGTLSVFITYWLVKKLLHDEKIALLSCLFLAISPWHLQFSRVAFESNASLFFVFLGLFFFIQGVKRGIWFIPAAVFFAISFYTYHSPRLVVPLIVLGWTYYFRAQILNHKKFIAVAIIAGFVLLIPFANEALTTGRARFSSVTVLKAEGQLDEAIQRTEFDRSEKDMLGSLLHNRRIVYARAVLKGYLDHFNLDFLFLTGDGPDRHHARDMGMLYFWEAPFVVLGILTLFRKNKFGFPVLWWFMVATAASAITTGTPHAVRALLLLPTYQIFTSVGILFAYKRWKKFFTSQLRQKFLIGLCLLVMGLNVYYYLEMYYVHTPIEASKDWQYGYKEVVNYIKQYESTVDKIIVTYAYDQPHIFVLFYNQVDPAWYQSQWKGEAVLRSQRGFGKYEFRKIVWENDRILTNTLLVGTPSELPDDAKKIADIYFLNGQIAFRIVKL